MGKLIHKLLFSFVASQVWVWDACHLRAYEKSLQKLFLQWCPVQCTTWSAKDQLFRSPLRQWCFVYSSVLDQSCFLRRPSCTAPMNWDTWLKMHEQPSFSVVHVSLQINSPPGARLLAFFLWTCLFSVLSMVSPLTGSAFEISMSFAKDDYLHLRLA